VGIKMACIKGEGRPQFYAHNQERLDELKNPITSLGIEPETFRLVA
jgi:hypothetical protein